MHSADRDEEDETFHGSELLNDDGGASSCWDNFSGTNLTTTSQKVNFISDLLEMSTSFIAYKAFESKNLNTNVLDPAIFHYLAYYAMIKGFLQILESAAMWKGEERSPKIAAAQFLSGLGSILAGVLYEFAGTSVSSLGLVLGFNALARIGVQWGRSHEWKKTSGDEVSYNIEREPVGQTEACLQSIALLSAAVGFFALTGSHQKLLAPALMANAALFFVSRVKKVYDQVQEKERQNSYQEL